MKPLRMIAIGLALSLVSACSTVSSHVEGYSAIPADISPRTVHIAPASWMDGDSLSFRQTAEQLAGVLATRGFTTAPRSQARLLATFSFETHEPITRVYTTREPIRETVTHEDSDGNKSSHSTIVGFRNETHERTVLPRVVRLTMEDARSGEQVYDGVVTSEDNCSDNPLVYSLMLQSLLQNFPAAEHGRVRMTAEDGC